MPGDGVVGGTGADVGGRVRTSVDGEWVMQELGRISKHSHK